VPLIKFLGPRSKLKRSEQPAPAPAAPPVAAPKPPAPTSVLPSTPGVKDITEVGAFYGRPALTEAEIEAVASGGASLL